MIITSATIEFDLPFVHSKKERRNILSSIKEKLKKQNLSLLDLSGEYPKEASLAIIFLSPTQQMAAQTLQVIEKNHG